MLNIFKTKINEILKVLKKEYTLIENMYSEEKIFKKSLPIKPSKNCDNKQKKEVQKLINSIFIPIFPTISNMVDSGIVELSSMSDKVDFSKIEKNNNITEKLIYESWDKLYINKYISYNITMSFIMQLYLIFEKELIFYMNLEYKDDFNGKTLFNALTFLEKKFRFSFDSNLKENINLYRNVINVHKHGKGESYYEIKKNYPNYINEIIETDNLDMTFLFVLEKITFNNLLDTLNEIIKKIKLFCD